MELDNDRLFLECECFSKDHIVLVEYDEWAWKDDSKEIELVISTQLRDYAGFWRRLKVAFLYLFKRIPNNLGSWQDTLVKVEDCPKLIELINKFMRRKAEEAALRQ